MLEVIIGKQGGQAFLLRRCDIIEVIDMEGEQVSDIFAVNVDEKTEVFSSGLTMMMNRSIRPVLGHKLYSNFYRPMLTIIKDDVGAHDLMVPCCRKESYSRGGSMSHPNCLDNLNNSFAPFEIPSFAAIQAMSISLNVSVSPDQTLVYAPPRSKAGDKVGFRAEMDVIVGVTACSDDMSACNNGQCKPIKIAIEKGTP
jgi:Uncharacterized conserved protein